MIPIIGFIIAIYCIVRLLAIVINRQNPVWFSTLALLGAIAIAILGFSLSTIHADIPPSP